MAADAGNASGISAPCEDDGDVVRAVARAQERDRYLAALLAPYDRRDDLVVLAAFAGELQRIPGYVSQPIIGEMRLQWWRDTVEAGLAEGDQGPAMASHPVARAISSVARRRNIGAGSLLALIDAQSARLEDMPFATRADLEANLAAWDGGLFSLAFRILGNPDVGAAEAEADAMLERAGVIYGLCRVLAEMGVERLQGRVLAPADLLGHHGATLAVVDPVASRAAWSAVAADFARWIEDRAAVLRSSYQAASREARLAALPVALVRPYLALSRRSDIAGGEIGDIHPLTRVVRLWAGYRLGLTGL